MKAGDIPLPNAPMPPPGRYLCRCASVEVKTARTGTPGLRLFWATSEGEWISDDLYITPKTVGRLVLVAQRVCGMSKEHELPDDKAEQATALADFIHAKIRGKHAIVIVEEEKGEYVPTEGDRVGERVSTSKLKVAFAGYETPVEKGAEAKPEITAPPSAPAPSAPASTSGAETPDSFEVRDDEIPF